MADSPYLGDAPKASPTPQNDVRLLVSINPQGGGTIREVVSMDPAEILAEGVTSVNGHTGSAVTLTTADLEDVSGKRFVGEAEKARLDSLPNQLASLTSKDSEIDRKLAAINTETVADKGDKLYVTAAQRQRLEDLPTVLASFAQSLTPAALATIIRQVLAQDGYVPGSGGGDGGTTTPAEPTPVTLPQLTLNPSTLTIQTDFASNQQLTSWGAGWPEGTVFAFSGIANDGRIVKDATGLDRGNTAIAAMEETTITVTATHPYAKNSDGTPVVRSATFKLTVKAKSTTPAETGLPLDGFTSLTPAYSPFRQLKTGVTKSATLQRGLNGATLDVTPAVGNFRGTAELNAFFETGMLGTFVKDGVTWTFNQSNPVRAIGFADQSGNAKPVAFDYTAAPQVIRDAAGQYAVWADSRAVFGRVADFFPVGGYEQLLIHTVVTLFSDAATDTAIISLSKMGDYWGNQNDSWRDKMDSGSSWRVLGSGRTASTFYSVRSYGYTVGKKWDAPVGKPAVQQFGRSTDKRIRFRTNGVEPVLGNEENGGNSTDNGPALSCELFLFGTPADGNGQAYSRAVNTVFHELFCTTNASQDSKLAERWGANSARALGMTTPDTEVDTNAPPVAVVGPYYMAPVATLPPTANASITTVEIVSTEAAGGSAAPATVKRVLSFRRGDVPGARDQLVRLSAGTGSTIQQDEETYWSDGSLKSAVVTITTSLAPGAKRTLTISSLASAPVRSTSNAASWLADRTNFVIRLSGHDLGTDVYEVSVNDILANGRAWPWGVNPVQGFTKIANGDARIEYAMWAMAKRTSDGARHRWLKVKVWVECIGPTQFTICARVVQSNSTGVNPNCTAGEATQPKHVFQAELLNKGVTLYRWGGAGDIRTQRITADNFNAANQSVGGMQGMDLVPMIAVPTAGSTLPAGLSSSEYFFPSWQSDGRMRMALTRQAGVEMGYYLDNAWASGKQFGYDKEFCHVDGVAWTIFRPQEDGRSVWDATAATTKPTGKGPFTDGNLVWNRMSAGPITGAGSGSIDMIPLVCVFPSCAADLVDMDTRGRINVDYTPRAVFMVPELTYMIRESGLTLPYDLQTVIDGTTGTRNVGRHHPGTMMHMSRDLNETGNGAGDERIGWINHSGALALLRPTNETFRQMALDQALSFSGYHIWTEDTAHGLCVMGNNGPARDGVDYPDNMKIRPGFRIGPYFEWGAVPEKAGYANRAGYYERYGRRVDSSHLPVPALACYLITGDNFFLDQLENEWCTNTNGEYQSDKWVNSTRFWRVQAANNGQSGRSIGWAVRLLGYANHLIPATRPQRAYVSDVYNENGNYIRALLQTFNAKRTALGIYTRESENNGGTAYIVQVWMGQFAWWALAMEAKRAEHEGWKLGFDHNSKFIFGMMDPAVGGCGYYSPARFVWINAPGTSGVASDENLVTSIPMLWDQTAKNMDTMERGPAGKPTAYDTCPVNSIILEFGSTGPSSLAQFAVSTAAVAAWMGLTNGPSVLASMKQRLTTANNNTDFRAATRNHPEAAFDYVAA